MLFVVPIVLFARSTYTVTENTTRVELALSLSNPLSFDAIVQVIDNGNTATGKYTSHALS